MHRPGANIEDMQPADFLCNFCEKAWDGLSPMVEGHQGNLICGNCLTVAYRALVMNQGETVGPGLNCTMCLEERDQSEWQSPIRDESIVCERCVRQAAQALSKDPESGWSRPDRD
jgi:hypothetical protein